MPGLTDFLPHTKHLPLKMVTSLATCFYSLAGLRILIIDIERGHLLQGLILCTMFFMMAASIWRLRYWAFQLTCAVLLYLSVFSVFFFFPPFGFESEINPGVFIQLWHFILFNACSLGFVAIVIVYRKDLARSF